MNEIGTINSLYVSQSLPAGASGLQRAPQANESPEIKMLEVYLPSAEAQKGLAEAPQASPMQSFLSAWAPALTQAGINGVTGASTQKDMKPTTDGVTGASNSSKGGGAAASASAGGSGSASASASAVGKGIAMAMAIADVITGASTAKSGGSKTDGATGASTAKSGGSKTDGATGASTAKSGSSKTDGATGASKSGKSKKSKKGKKSKHGKKNKKSKKADGVTGASKGKK